jgi:hypothetical protein
MARSAGSLTVGYSLATAGLLEEPKKEDNIDEIKSGFKICNRFQSRRCAWIR